MGANGHAVHFCSNVGGGVFGEGQVNAWRALGFDARLHHAVELADYWRAKSGLWSKLRLRWAMYVRYPRMLHAAVRRAGAEETFVAVTNPFFVPALAARTARRSGAKVVHLVYDLYPDALIFGGGWSPRHPVARFAARTTRGAIRNCDATVYLGERLRRHAEAQYGVAPRTAVIPVGTDASVFAGCGPTARPEATVRCLYSGHMGRLHDAETLATALGAGVPAGVAVELAADGPGANALKSALGEVAQRSPQQLTFAGTRGNSEWRAAMLAADVALVTMRPGAEKVVMPSKTYSAMAAGQAILAVCPRESDLADLVVAHDCGWVVAPGDAAGLRALLESLPARREEVLQKRRRAFAAAQERYSMTATATQWSELFRSLHEH
jgi:glycosyltransferase involved in cell wall biosynthesis